MDLRRLYAGSFIDWGAVAASWNKRTVPSRLLLFAARRYLDEGSPVPDEERAAMLGRAPLADEIKAAFASPPQRLAYPAACCTQAEFGLSASARFAAAIAPAGSKAQTLRA